MPFKKLALLLLLSVLASCHNRGNEVAQVQIIPQPNSIEITETRFILNEQTKIFAPELFKVSSEFLKSFIKNGNGLTLSETSKINHNTIVFRLSDEITHPEAYHLQIATDAITISAATDKGAFYGVQSLRQLFPIAFEEGNYLDKDVSIPGVSIEDAPRFTYRGMHLDVGRHFFDVDFIKSYIDALAMLKFNTFHWHLTEDQGWRIEIKSYPKLQEVAAFRKETLIGHYSEQPQQFDGQKYGGYYTQDEIKDIVSYAKTKHVTIIPEIELPGHSQAAIAAYPELGCTGEPIEVATKWGVFEEIYCTKEDTFEFLENVFDEVITLFPGKYIHIGGDEAPKTRWKSCANCQQRIASEGLKNEHELQSYFIKRIENYLNSKGRQIIGWDEILEGGLAPNATVMSWRGTAGAIAAAQQSHDVVMTPTSHCYFDYYQSDTDDEPLAIGGYLPLEKVYAFDPIPKELTTTQSKFIIGAQGNLWTEYISTEDQAQYMLFPRMLAMSEVVWTHPEQKDYKDFVSRVETFNKRLDALDFHYANHLYEVEGQLLTKDGMTHYELSTLTDGKHIRYTLDAPEPDILSEHYTDPIPINESVTIKAAVFNTTEKLGRTFEETIEKHKAVGQKISINKQPNKAYPGSGPQGLINGVSGSDTRYGDKEWLGFWGDDIEIVIDLGTETDIQSIETRFHNGQGQWIYAPKTIYIAFDQKEKTMISLEDEEGATEIIKYVTINALELFGTSIRTRYITLTIPNYGIIPEGQQGAGNKAWTFIDEIIIK